MRVFKSFILGIVVTLLAVSFGRTAEIEPKPVVIPNAEQFDQTSKGGRDYRIFVATPLGEPPTAGFPVYYFTDANASFGTVASLARIQQRTIGPVLLVGIGYPTDDRETISVRRTYDLTPPTPPETMRRFRATKKSTPPGPAVAVPKASDDKTGGQEEFFTFIETELKPLVEKRFKIDKSRQALFGHSFGGLFTLHVMLKHTDNFQTYIAASPSLWLNPEKVNEEATMFAADAASRSANSVRLLMTIGELEPASPFGVDSQAKGDRVSPPAKVNPRDVFIERLAAGGIRPAFKIFEGENHGSVVPFAHMRGLRFAFEQPRSPAPSSVAPGAKK